MKIDPAAQSSFDNYKLMTSCLVPRPIAFVSTQRADGARNLSPFSYFMGVGSDPPMVAVSISVHPDGPKDTIRNVRESGELVVNLVSEDIAAAMILASGEYVYGKDEFAVAGLTPAPSTRVKPPRVAESPVSFECKVLDIREYGPIPATLVVCQIVYFHVRDALYLADKGRVDTAAMHAVGRLGGIQYCRTQDMFEIPRPVVDEREG